MHAGGNPAAARALWTKAVHFDNESAQAYNDLGVLSIDEQDFKTAESRFERALKVNPGYLEFFDEPKIADFKAQYADYWVDKPVLVFASNA